MNTQTAEIPSDELNLLYCLMAGDRKLFDYASKFINSAHFASELGKKTWDDISELYGEFADIESVPLLKLKDNNSFVNNLFSNINLISSLFAGDLSPLGIKLESTFTSCIDSLLQSYAKSLVVNSRDFDWSSFSQRVDEIKSIQMIIKERQEGACESLGVDLHSKLTEFMEGKFPEDSTFSSGLNKIDQAVIGLRRGSITSCVAKSGHGKTSLGLQMLMAQAKAHPSLSFQFFSKEEPYEDVRNRIIRLLTGINMVTYFSQSKQVMVDERYVDRSIAVERLGGLLDNFDKSIPPNLKIIARGFKNVDDIVMKMRESEEEIGGIVIDHWHLLDFDSASNKTESQEKDSTKLLNTIKENKVHCLLLCQGKKSQERLKHLPLTEDDIKGSAAVRDASAQVWVLNNPFEMCGDPSDDHNKTYIEVRKCRNVRPGTKVSLTFDGARGRFKEW